MTWRWSWLRLAWTVDSGPPRAAVVRWSSFAWNHPYGGRRCPRRFEADVATMGTGPR